MDEGKKGTILLVEDDPAVMQMTGTLLGYIGYKVISCRDGYKAIKTFKIRHSKIDCILLDIRMPGIDGEETFEKLMAIAKKPVIFTTGLIDKHLTPLIDKGSFILKKPYTKEELTTVLDALIKKE